MVYKEGLLVVAAIFIIVGAILLFANIDVSGNGVSLANVLIIIGIIFIIIWAILYAVVNVVNR